MSKITFRADDDLVERVEALDASKSEVMREALRAYLDGQEAAVADLDLLDELVAERVEAVLDDRLPESADSYGGGADGDREVTVNVTVESADGRARVGDATSRARERNVGSSRVDEATVGEATADPGRSPPTAEDSTCARCGEQLSDGHVFCPNCGEKATRRLFCECGDELRSDWAYCPGCGRRTPSAEVLDG